MGPGDPGLRCREDARVHYEGVNVHARRIARSLSQVARIRGTEKVSCLISQSSTVCQVLAPRGRPQVPRQLPASGERQY